MSGETTMKFAFGSAQTSESAAPPQHLDCAGAAAATATHRRHARLKATRDGSRNTWGNQMRLERSRSNEIRYLDGCKELERPLRRRTLASAAFSGKPRDGKREVGMVASTIVRVLAMITTALSAGISFAQTPAAPTARQAPESLVLYFGLGSAEIRSQDEALLDQASRLYRDGNPIVMIVAGSADTVGPPERNLSLSQQRADAVLRGLISRGIPVGRFQLVAKGETDLAVPTEDDVPEHRNRRVEITWR